MPFLSLERRANTLWATLLSTAVLAAGVAAFQAANRQRQNNHNNNEWSTEIPAELRQANSLYQKELQLAVQMALRAGAAMAGWCHAKGSLTESTFSLDIQTKSSHADFCTKVDVENERAILKDIQTHFPHHLIIGEETVGTGTIDPLTDAPTWIVDPVDGTLNFSNGLPLTCVSIALVVQKKPVLGVIYAPMTQEMYMAVDGCGAFRNGQRIAERLNSTQMIDALICVEMGYPRDPVSIRKINGAVEGILTKGCRAMRQLGSGCLDLCYVATGRLDVVYAGVAAEGWKPWDYAAGAVVLQECNCILEGIPVKTRGKAFDLYSTSLIAATNRELADEVRSAILDVKYGEF